LFFRTIPFPKLLDLVAALEGRFKWDGSGHGFPVGDAEISAVDGVPFVTVGFD
jgi:hypothetical protein